MPDEQQQLINWPAFHYRVRVGVTGHRLLPENPELVTRIRQVLDEIERHVGASSEFPIQWEIVSCLADGADRLVARETLLKNNVILRAVIPLPTAEYEKTFGVTKGDGELSEEDRLLSCKEFREFLSDPHSRPVYLQGEVAATRGVDAHDPTGERKQAYRKGSEYVVRNCDVLIALYNPSRPRHAGGTGDTIALAKELGVPIYIIDIRRPPFTIKRRKLCRFDVCGYQALRSLVGAAMRPGEETSRLRQAEGPFEPEKTTGLDSLTVAAFATHLQPYYERASVLAKRNQAKYYRAGIAAYVLAIIAVASVIVGALWEEQSYVFFAAEALCLMSILALVWFARWRGFHRRWIAFRFLAERLRAASFLTAVGIQPSALRRGSAPTGFTAQCDWTAHAYNQIIKVLNDHWPVNNAGLDAKRGFIVKEWIIDQENWHRSRARKYIRRGRLFEFLATVMFSATVAVALFHIVFHFLYPGRLNLNLWATLAALALPSIGAALSWFRSHRDYQRLAVRSEDMAAQLQEITPRVDAATNSEAFEKIMREVDEIMLVESQDWRGLVKFLNVTRP